MKELITVAASFIIVVALALYMYVSNQTHSTAVIKNHELNQVVEKNYNELNDVKTELEGLKEHVRRMDSIYHK